MLVSRLCICVLKGCCVGGQGNGGGATSGANGVLLAMMICDGVDRDITMNVI